MLQTEPKSLEELMSRYSTDQMKVVRKYWNCIRHTRRTAKISAGVIQRWMDKWSKYETRTIVEAMLVHVSKHQDKREEYTAGIIRGMSKGGEKKNDKQRSGADVFKDCGESQDKNGFERGRFQFKRS